MDNNSPNQHKIYRSDSVNLISFLFIIYMYFSNKYHDEFVFLSFFMYLCKNKDIYCRIKVNRI